MTSREINKGSIVEYLAKKGIYPAKKYNGYCMYYSPLRSKENTPSFKVSMVSNLWVDYGNNNEGGTLIDLILKMNPGYSVSRIIAEYNNKGDFSFHQPKKNEIVPVVSQIKIMKTEPIENNLQLCAYLEGRGIDFTIATDYVECISYEIRNRVYKGIAARNMKGGYNITSHNFKCATKQGATFYSHNSGNSLILTEGIMDHLSFLMLYPEQIGTHDFCVLNSVHNLSSVYDILKKYKQIICFLDNDIAGNKATLSVEKYVKSKGISFFDYRARYKEFKDLNDCLMGILM